MVFLSLEDAESMRIGALGEIAFESGLYIYVGSARNSVEKRVGRHFSSPEKSFWHIDYFSEKAEAADYFVLPEKSSYECFMADRLGSWCEKVDGFGSSDCDCDTHLFRVPESF